MEVAVGRTSRGKHWTKEIMDTSAKGANSEAFGRNVLSALMVITFNLTRFILNIYGFIYMQTRKHGKRVRKGGGLLLCRDLRHQLGKV